MTPPPRTPEDLEAFLDAWRRNAEDDIRCATIGISIGLAGSLSAFCLVGLGAWKLIELITGVE